MDESLFLVSDVHKGSVQGRQQLFHFSEVYITHRKIVALARLLVELDQLVVLQQSYRDFR